MEISSLKSHTRGSRTIFTIKSPKRDFVSEIPTHVVTPDCSGRSLDLRVQSLVDEISFWTVSGWIRVDKGRISSSLREPQYLEKASTGCMVTTGERGHRCFTYH